MRGKRLARRAIGSGDRITPARAGKTLLIFPISVKPADHPRACGENSENAPSSDPAFGSPPRVRGKPTHSRIFFQFFRITPARAGKTGMPPRVRTSFTDHPRACGENRTVSRIRRPERGSPPRVRGKLNPKPCEELHQGITPARAGKTWNGSRWQIWRWDHPRACGENAMGVAG